MKTILTSVAHFMLQVHKPGKEVSLHLAGLPKSGKTTMFKQLVSESSLFCVAESPAVILSLDDSSD